MHLGAHALSLEQFDLTDSNLVKTFHFENISWVTMHNINIESPSQSSKVYFHTSLESCRNTCLMQSTRCRSIEFHESTSICEVNFFKLDDVRSLWKIDFDSNEPDMKNDYHEYSVAKLGNWTR